VYQLLAAKGVPFVNTWVLDDAHPSVGFDNHAIGQALANYLLDLGHREFGIVAQQSPQSDRAAKRVAGIRAAVAARGLPEPRLQLTGESHKIVDGQLAFQALMETTRRPTAVICGTDTLAFGALVQAQAMGAGVPGDVSVTGINDAEFAEHLTPPLTTIRLEAGVVGMRSADYLLARIGGQAVANSTNIPFTLVVRGSTAAPRRRGR
jgi:LacI family transcriptional regulator